MPDRLDAEQKRLKAARDKARRAKLGPVLSQSDEDLARLSKAGPENLAEIEAYIRDAAGQRGVDMFRAKAE